MPNFQTVRGMRDLLPDEAAALNRVIAKARETAALYGFREVITPVVEPYELLSAKSGEEIRQRMFTFKDLGDRKIVLRPEFTASIARLVTVALKNEPKPLRLFSVGSVYRYDEPQQGRYREFWQSNFELMGSCTPEADAEVILITDKLMKAVGLRNYEFKLGHVGVLKAIFNQENIDEQTQNTILQKMDKKEYDVALKLVTAKSCRNVLQSLIQLRDRESSTVDPINLIKRIEEIVENYPAALNAVQNLSAIFGLVSKSGCEIRNLDPSFARGLEYYTGMIFEVYIPELDIALGGGGRYDRLIETFGGESTAATGVAHGLDRIALALQTQNADKEAAGGKRAAVIPVKDELKGEALKIAQLLRASGIAVEFEVMGRKMGKALEDADKRQVDYAVIVGEKELQQNAVVLKDLAKREQVTVAVSGLVEKIRS